jgi:hypothetical protein
MWAYLDTVTELVEPYVAYVVAYVGPQLTDLWASLIELRGSRSDLEWIIIAFALVALADVINFLG